MVGYLLATFCFWRRLLSFRAIIIGFAQAVCVSKFAKG
jgi:hypothetical protein